MKSESLLLHMVEIPRVGVPIKYFERELIIIERDEVYIYQYKGKEVKA